MLNEVFMPKLGMTMETGVIIRWFKNEGDPVKVGDLLLEVLTDKINIEVEAYHDGILLKRYYGEDETVPVNEVIGYIGEQGDVAPDSPPSSSGAEAQPAGDAGNADLPKTDAASSGNCEPGAKPRATPAARKLAGQQGIELSSLTGSGPNGRIHRADVEDAGKGSHAAASIKATPLARKVAEEHNVGLESVAGSGDNGKIMRADIMDSIRQQPAAASSTTASGTPKTIKLDGIRKAIGDHMSASAFTAPHVTLTSEVNMAQSVQAREKLLPIIEKQIGLRVSFTEIIIKAVAAALSRHPLVNSSLVGDSIVLHDDINVGMAVSAPKGLFVPVVRHADRKGLAELTSACKDLARRARDQKLAPDDLKGGTFTVSNLGMYAVDAFTPVINRPEAAILGVGRIQEKPVAINHAIVLQPMMTLSLSFDHRIMDGAPAAAFLTELKEILENPYQLLV